jgi:hypothetical protein
VLFDPILYGVLVPLTISIFVQLVAWFVRRKRLPASDSNWPETLAVGLAFLAGFVGLFGKPAFPPTEAMHRLAYLAAAIAILGLVDSIFGLPAGLRAGTRSYVGLAALAFLAWPMFGQQWTPLESAAWMAGLGAALLIYWSTLDALPLIVPRLSLLLIVLATLIAGSLTLLSSGSAKLALLAGVLAASVGPGLILCWITKRRVLDRGTLSIVVVVQAGLLFAGYFFGELTKWFAVLLAVAPLTMWFDRIFFVRDLRPWLRGLICLVVGIAPLALALWLSLQASPGDSPTPSDESGLYD